jgi:hypothetical protein
MNIAEGLKIGFTLDFRPYFLVLRNFSKKQGTPPYVVRAGNGIEPRWPVPPLTPTPFGQFFVGCTAQLLEGDCGNVVSGFLENGAPAFSQIFVEFQFHVPTGSIGTETYRSRDISDP